MFKKLKAKPDEVIINKIKSNGTKSKQRLISILISFLPYLYKLSTGVSYVNVFSIQKEKKKKHLSGGKYMVERYVYFKVFKD